MRQLTAGELLAAAAKGRCSTMFRSARDIARAKKFNAALKPLGFSLLSDGESCWAMARRRCALLGATKKPVKAEMDSGLHFCFLAKDRAAVDAFHAAALKAGGERRGRRCRPMVSEILRRRPSTPTAIGKPAGGNSLAPGVVASNLSDDDARCSSGAAERDAVFAILTLAFSGIATRWTWPEPKAYIEAAALAGVRRGGLREGSALRVGSAGAAPGCR